MHLVSPLAQRSQSESVRLLGRIVSPNQIGAFPFRCLAVDDLDVGEWLKLAKVCWSELRAELQAIGSMVKSGVK